MRNPTATSYREDPLYPRIATAVEDILERGNVVAPLDVLVETAGAGNPQSPIPGIADPLGFRRSFSESQETFAKGTATAVA